MAYFDDMGQQSDPLQQLLAAFSGMPNQPQMPQQKTIEADEMMGAPQAQTVQPQSGGGGIMDMLGGGGGGSNNQDLGEWGELIMSFFA